MWFTSAVLSGKNLTLSFLTHLGTSRGVARIFKGGGEGRFFIEKGKAGSERCLRRWVPGWSPGRHSISLDLKAPDCEKIDILNAFFLSEFFQYNDDFYGDLYGDTFVATNFLISLFLLFPLYDFNPSHPPTPPPGYAPDVRPKYLRLTAPSVSKAPLYPCCMCPSRSLYSRFTFINKRNALSKTEELWELVSYRFPSYWNFTVILRIIHICDILQ